MNNKKKQRALVPRLRFPEFRDAPEWEESTVGSRCKTFSGGTPDTTRKEFYDGTIPFIRSAEIGSDTTEMFLTEEGLESSAAKMVTRGDVLVALYGANSGDVALACVDGAINQAILCLRPEGSKAFLYHYLTQKKAWILATYLQGGQGNLSSDIVKSISLRFPSPAEQQRIADCLSALDDLITAQAEKLDALRTHKRGLMQQLFPREGETRPRMRFPEFRDAGEWDRNILGEIADIAKGKGISKSDIVEGGQTPCIRYGELYTIYGEIIEDVRSSTNLPASELVLSKEGDVIIPASGETKEDIATCACVAKDGVALGSDLNIIRSPIDGRFFSYYLNGSRRRELAKVAQGDTVSHLYPTQLSRFVIYIPPDKTEQQRIADCLSALDDLIAAQAEKLDALRTHKRGLMQKLFPSMEDAEA